MKIVRKISFILVLSLVLTTLLPFCASADVGGIPMLGDLDQAEIALYGNPNGTQAVVQRLDGMERTLYGGTFPTSIPERVGQIKNLLTANSKDSPSLVFQIKADEWVAQQKIGYGSLIPRLDNIERTLTGTNQQIPVIQKLQKMNNLCFKNGVIVPAMQKVSQGTLVKVEFLNGVSSKTSREGDPIDFQVVDNVTVDGVLVIPAGSRAKGRVAQVSSAKGFGKDGKLELDFNIVDGFDGTPVPLTLGDKAKEQNKNLAYAAGASVTGAILLGPIGLVGGAFVKGRQAEIPAGTQFYLEVKDSTPVMGLVVNSLAGQ